MLSWGEAAAFTQWPPGQDNIVAHTSFRSGGAGFATAQSSIEIGPLQCAQLALTASFPSVPTSPFSTAGIGRRVLMVDGGVVGVLSGLCGSQGFGGATFNPATGMWEFTGAMTGTADTTGMTFADADFDANGDGRFNAPDIPALVSLLGTQDPDVISRWDFNRDGVFDQTDIDFVQALVDEGLDSGIFGDADRDGVVRCDDRDALLANLGASLCGAGYNISLDQDLDGDNDAADLDALDAIPPSPLGDLNHDGIVNSNDISAILNLFGSNDPEGDLNGDGVVNSADISFILSNFNMTCG